MRRTIKYIIPLIGILYCIAFFEAEVISTQEQTYNDEYDLYTYSPSKYLATKQFTQHDIKSLGLTPNSKDIRLTKLWNKSASTFLKKEVFPFRKKLFVNNCIWLI